MRDGGVTFKSFAAPDLVMIPLNMLESVTRVFSMFVRLFGNVMSGVFVIGIVASFACLLAVDIARKLLTRLDTLKVQASFLDLLVEAICQLSPDWLGTAQGIVERAMLGSRLEQRDRVEVIGGGVAMVSGLPGVRLDEVLRFEGGQTGSRGCWTPS